MSDLPTRRRVLTLGLGVTAVALFGSYPTASAATPGLWTAATSANGWPIVGDVTVQRVEGSNVTTAVLDGDAGVVLLYVARRFHYEIDNLQPGEVAGHSTDRTIAAPFESNHLSGTAIAIRPRAYPMGVRGELFPQELTVVRGILADCQGVVSWGGDESTPKESHFQIAVGPNDARLARLADRIRGSAL